MGSKPMGDDRIFSRYVMVLVTFIYHAIAIAARYSIVIYVSV